MARVGQDRTIPHDGHVASRDHVPGTGRGDEQLAQRRRVGHRQYPVALHHRVQRADRVNLGHDHLRAEPAGPLRDAPAAPAVTGYHHGPAGQQDVRGPHDAVDGGLAGAVRSLQHQPGSGSVRGHRREGEGALAGHPVQPDHPGRRGLAAAGHLAQQVRPLRVQRLDEVTAVVDHQVRPGVQGLLDVVLVRPQVGPGPGVHHGRAAGIERGGDVVLGGQRVRGGQEHPGPACLPGADQDRGLRGHVQAGGHGQPGQRLLGGEPPGDAAQHGHGPLGPADPGLATAGQPGVRDIGRRARPLLGHQDGGGVSTGSGPACTDPPPGRRYSQPAPWSAR